LRLGLDLRFVSQRLSEPQVAGSRSVPDLIFSVAHTKESA
jgi:hypothetical protein